MYSPGRPVEIWTGSESYRLGRRSGQLLPGVRVLWEEQIRWSRLWDIVYGEHPLLACGSTG